MKLKILLLLSIFGLSFAQKTPYEKGNGNQTTTYEEMNAFYENLDKKYESIKVFPYEGDDNGEKIYVVVYNPDKDFNFNKKQEKAVLLINNGIHPGESDGIDASMMMMRDLANGTYKTPKNVIIASIGCYNISGMMRRGKFSRANQNGPEEHGFRGNARNYDLNRDFIKLDTKNSSTFHRIFHDIKPDVLIDNHVSNGADYQYLFTYISTNKERLGNSLGNFLHQVMQPEILKSLDKKNILYAPYVNIHGDTPEGGYGAFMDSPRYTTGYTTLFNVLGTVSETHMLKPYPKRVEATLEYMLSTINYLEKNYQLVKEARRENLKHYSPGKKYSINWDLDQTATSMISFKGYAAERKPSEVSGQPRLYYDRSKPFTKDIPFFGSYKSTKSIIIPKYYVIPQSEWKVMNILNDNQIKFKKIKKDTLITTETYFIKDYKTTKYAYEGHYFHYDVNVDTKVKQQKVRKGDYLISTEQEGVKFLLETLEPEAEDSFFAWNYFDNILGQKEYYSDYVFEDTAAELLKNNPKLREELEKKKKEDTKFAENPKAQLDWMYKNSPYYEGTVNMYPIYRIL